MPENLQQQSYGHHRIINPHEYLPNNTTEKSEQSPSNESFSMSNMTLPNARNYKQLLASVLVALLLPLDGIAQSGVHPSMKDDFVMQFGAFLPRLNFQLGVDGSLTGDHPPLDFEGQVGAKKNDEIFAAELIWRFGDKWSLRGQYFAGGQKATATLEEDIEWGDAVFESGSFISGATELEIDRIFFARDFSNSDHHEFGLGLGFHRMSVGASLTGNLIVNGEQFIAETRAVSAVAPLPNIGVWYAYSPSEKWAFDIRLDWLDASIGEYSGGLTNAAIGANYQVFKHVGIGLKYQVFKLRLDITKQDWNGQVKLAYEGLYIYFSANWS